jgi:predicted PurR-regulated permease PerM
MVAVAALTGTPSCTALWALAVPYPLLLGGWEAFCSFIPMFGTCLGVVPALALVTASTSGLGR